MLTTNIEITEETYFAILEESAGCLMAYRVELEKAHFTNVIYCRNAYELEIEMRQKKIKCLLLSANHCTKELLYINKTFHKIPYYLISQFTEEEIALEMAKDLIEEGYIGILTRHWYRNQRGIEKVRKTIC